MKKMTCTFVYFTLCTSLYDATCCMEDVIYCTEQATATCEDAVMEDAEQPQAHQSAPLYRCTCGSIFQSPAAFSLHCKMHTAELRAMASNIATQQMDHMVVDMQALTISDAAI